MVWAKFCWETVGIIIPEKYNFSLTPFFKSVHPNHGDNATKTQVGFTGSEKE